MNKTQALQNLRQSLREATESGLLDDLAGGIHPDEINRFCDAVVDMGVNEQEQWVIQRSRENCSHLPVTTARYVIEVVMNEDEASADNEKQMAAMADEFQRALDNGFFEDIRYDALRFQVVSRTVLHVAPPND